MRNTLTIREFYETKVYALDDVIYSRIENKFIILFRNDKLGKKVLEKFWEMTVQDLSTNSYVDIMDCFEIMG